MYLYFNRNGVLKEIISDAAVREGSYGYDKVYVYFENDAVTSATANIKFSDNTTVTVTLTREVNELEIPYNPERDLKYFEYYKEYQFYSFVLGNTDPELGEVYSLINGLTEMSISAVINANTVQMQGLVVFMIENSTVVPDTTITQADFQYLLNLMSNKEDKPNKTSEAGDSTTLYASQKLVKLVNISGKTYSETLDFLADVKMPYYYSNGRMYLYKTHDVDWNLYFTSFDAIANKIYIAIFTENIGPQDVGSLTIEKQENKSNTLTDSTTQYPTTHAVKSAVDTINASINNINNNNVVRAYLSPDQKTLYLIGKYNGTSYNLEFQGGGGGLSQVDWGQIQGQIQEQTDLVNFVNSSVATNTANFIGTFSNVGLLIYNGYMVAGSIILAGSTLKAGSQMGETTLDEDLTLDTDLTLDENGMLAMGSTIVTGSTIEAGSVLNNVYYEEDTTLDEDLILREITNNDYAFVTNSQYDFSSVEDMESQSTTTLTNYDYGWIPNDDKYDLYRFDIVTQEWSLQATAVSKTDVTPDVAYNRYKYTAETSEWTFEYTLNNSSFTAVQWAAINSGITSAMLTNFANELDEIETNLSLGPDGVVITNALGKLDTSSVTPTELGYLSGASSNLQTQISKKLPGVFVTQAQYNALVSAGTVEQDVLYIITDDTTALLFDNVVLAVSNLQTAVAGKQNTLTWDNSPTYGSTNAVNSGVVYDALQLKQTKLTAGSGINIQNAVISADLSNIEATSLKATGITNGYVLTANNGVTQWSAPPVIKTHCIEVVTSGNDKTFNFQIINMSATAFTEASIITYLGATAKITGVMQELSGGNYNTYAGTLNVVSSVLTFNYTSGNAVQAYQFDGTETLTDTVL